MATGTYLRVGGETSSGGEIIEGCGNWLINGLPIARDGGAAIPVCIVAGVGAVALGGGILGAMGGERISEIIYERFR